MRFSQNAIFGRISSLCVVAVQRTIGKERSNFKVGYAGTPYLLLYQCSNWYLIEDKMVGTIRIDFLLLTRDSGNRIEIL